MLTDPAYKKIIIFCGRSVSQQDLDGAFPDAAHELVFAPPAGFGDVWKHIRADTAGMVIIDCIHGDGPSVWHREILSALDAGISVFGAGGIGALRASEMSAMGMAGVGSVYERLENGHFEADDEVLSGPDGFALVTLRLALEKITTDAVLTREEAGQMIAYFRNIYFARRSWRQIHLWLQNEIELPRRKKAVSYLKTHARDPRPDDAIAAVRLALKDPGQPVHSAGPDMNNCITAMLRPKWRLSEMYHRCFVFNQTIVPAARVLDMAGALQKTWDRDLKSAFFVKQWLKEKKISPPPGFVSTYVKQKISKKEPVFDFLMENSMTFKEWKGLLQRQSHIIWAKQMSGSLLPGFSHKDCFAEAWAADHGVVPPRESDVSPGQWVVEKGPEHFGFIWEGTAEFFDLLRLSGRASQFAAMCSEKEVYNV